MSKKKETTEEIELPTLEEITIQDTVIVDSLTEEDAALQNAVSSPKVNLLEQFILNKPELCRYSMSTAFKNFCAKHKETYNDFKTQADINAAYDKFFS
jgi:hypothetical protein